jgi:hypothetical protein
MKLLKILAIAVMAMVSSVSAQAGVVLSNAASGVSSSGIDDNTGTKRNAVGFTTTDSFTVDYVRAAIFGIANPGVVPIKMGIYNDASGVPGTTLITESTATNVGGGAPPPFSTFTFSDNSTRTLSAGTYWVIITQNAVDAAWYKPVGTGTPTDPNLPLSGVTYVSSLFNEGAGWTVTSNRTFELAGTVGSAAVPEPALTSLLCLSGIALIRRRMKK